MSSRAKLSIPTNASIPDARRLPTSNSDVHKALSRLSRASLIRLALQWLQNSNISRCAPFLTANEIEDDAAADDAPWLAAQSVEELREAYEEQQARKGGKREIIDRILEGDWRHGISLYQLAMAETMYLQEKSTSQKWHALRLVPVQDNEDDAESSTEGRLPHIQRQAFLQSLQREIGPLAKAHYYLTRNEEKTYTLLRILLFDLPYNTQRALTSATSSKRSASETTKSIFVVFPDATPFVYVSVPTTVATSAASESRSLQKLVIDVRVIHKIGGAILTSDRPYLKRSRDRRRGTHSRLQPYRPRLCRRCWRYEAQDGVTQRRVAGVSLSTMYKVRAPWLVWRKLPSRILMQPNMTRRMLHLGPSGHVR